MESFHSLTLVGQFSMCKRPRTKTPLDDVQPPPTANLGFTDFFFLSIGGPFLISTGVGVLKTTFEISVSGPIL